MKIYKLTPLEGGDGDWERSVFKGQAVIRAENERDSRSIADFSFGIGKNGTFAEDITFGPWQDSDSVSCEEISDDAYPAEGPRIVISSKEWAEEVTFNATE